MPHDYVLYGYLSEEFKSGQSDCGDQKAVGREAVTRLHGVGNRSKLRWLCRRGSLELDIILSRYLESCYDEACDTEQRLFEHLLDLPDTELQRIFIGQQNPTDPGILNLVSIIRSIDSNIT